MTTSTEEVLARNRHSTPLARYGSLASAVPAELAIGLREYAQGGVISRPRTSPASTHARWHLAIPTRHPPLVFRAALAILLGPLARTAAAHATAKRIHPGGIVHRLASAVPGGGTSQRRRRVAALASQRALNIAEPIRVAQDLPQRGKDIPAAMTSPAPLTSLGGRFKRKRNRQKTSSIPRRRPPEPPYSSTLLPTLLCHRRSTAARLLRPAQINLLNNEPRPPHRRR